MWLPQLSPMMGVMVFVCTNLAFTILFLSIRPFFNVESSSINTSSSAQKAFRGFS